MNTVRVGFNKLRALAQVPAYGSDQAAGADLCAAEQVFIPAMQHALVKTGIAIELPEGYEAQVRPRSGLALKHGITVLNSPGTIDSDYRGEVGVILMNLGGDVFEVKPGDRIAQLVIAPVMRAEFVATGGVLSQTARGEAGFGSTGIETVLQ